MTDRPVEVSDAPLSRRERQEAAVVAARAFHTDPFFVYLSPNAVLRSIGLAQYSGSVASHLGPKGTLLTARRDGAIVGVAGWVAPGGYPYPMGTQLAQLMGSVHALYRVPPALVRGLRYLLALEKAHLKAEHWYLQLLVCDPEHQRTGVGAALLHDVLARCDHDGVPSYLETQKEANLAYYRRFGYEVTATLNPVAGGPPLWTMQREPKAPTP